MKILSGKLNGLLIIEPDIFRDERGYFYEFWQQARHQQSGLPHHFIQDNLSRSARGVLRGLHFQNPMPQGKLISVLRGEAFDVAVDLRKNSPTFGQWEGQVLTEENHRQLYIPEGFAHGFLALSEEVLLFYKCTGGYSREYEKTLLWNDPAIGIVWPLSDPVLSPKDLQGKRLSDFLPGELF